MNSLATLINTPLYLLRAFATLVLPVPRLGITPAVIAAQQIHATGLWVEQPQRVLALGVVYFLLTGWSDLRGHDWTSGIKVARS